MILDEHFHFLAFLQNLAVFVGFGLIASVSIALNVRVQKAWKVKPGAYSNFIQSVTYIISIVVSALLALYLYGFVIDYKNLLWFEVVIFFLGLALPFIIAVWSGFIPKDR